MRRGRWKSLPDMRRQSSAIAPGIRGSHRDVVLEEERLDGEECIVNDSACSGNLEARRRRRLIQIDRLACPW